VLMRTNQSNCLKVNADLRKKYEEVQQKLDYLMQRHGTEEFIQQRENELKRLKEELRQLGELHAQTSKALSTQIELTKREKAHVVELDNRLAEATKKYDDSKKAYFKSKDERERLRQELDKYKADGVKE